MCTWGIEEITFNQLGGVDRPEFFPEHRLTVENVQWLESKASDVANQLKLRGVQLRGGAAYMHRLKATAENIRLPVDDCRPAEAFLFIDEQGRIAPCNFTANEYGIRLQDISTLEALKQLPARFAQMRSNTRSAFCEDCHSTQQFAKFAA